MWGKKSQLLAKIFPLYSISLFTLKFSADLLTCLSQETPHKEKQPKPTECMHLPASSKDKWLSRRRNV